MGTAVLTEARTEVAACWATQTSREWGSNTLSTEPPCVAFGGQVPKHFSSLYNYPFACPPQISQNCQPQASHLLIQDSWYAVLSPVLSLTWPVIVAVTRFQSSDWRATLSFPAWKLGSFSFLFPVCWVFAFNAFLENCLQNFPWGKVPNSIPGTR